MVTGIVRQLESLGVDEITTRDIGGAAMEALKSIDKVAYIRFAVCIAILPKPATLKILSISLMS